MAVGKRGFRTRERFLLLPRDLNLVSGVRYVLLVSNDLKFVYKAKMMCYFKTKDKKWPWKN